MQSSYFDGDYTYTMSTRHTRLYFYNDYEIKANYIAYIYIFIIVTFTY